MIISFKKWKPTKAKVFEYFGGETPLEIHHW